MFAVTMQRSVGVAIVLLAAACSTPAPHTRVVTGAIHRASEPVVAVPVRFVLAPTAEARACAPVLAEAVTNDDGTFAISAQYVPAEAASRTTRVHHHAVCAQIDGQWSPIWNFTAGPALHNISLRCSQDEGGRVFCVR